MVTVEDVERGTALEGGGAAWVAALAGGGAATRGVGDGVVFTSPSGNVNRDAGAGTRGGGDDERADADVSRSGAATRGPGVTGRGVVPDDGVAPDDAVAPEVKTVGGEAGGGVTCGCKAGRDATGSLDRVMT